MKKIGFIIVILILFLIFSFKKQLIENYTITYTINEFEIQETANFYNQRYYDFTIKKDKKLYSFTITKDIFDKKLIKNINEYEDGSLSCINITFKSSKISSLIQCSVNGEMVSYYSLYNQIPTLDNFIKNEWNFSFSNQIEPTIKDNLTIYKNNFLKDDNLIVYDYRGINIINNKDINYIELFEKDIYKNEQAFVLNNYYISPNIQNDYNFNEMFIINLKNENKKIKKLNTNISLSSYKQKEYDEKMYLFDIDNMTQYQIDENEVKEVGNKRINALYFDNENKSNRKNIYDYINIKLDIFGNTIYDNYEQDATIHYNNKFYKIEKIDNIYYMFRYFNEDTKTLLFTIDDIKEVQIIDDTIYFISNEKIKKYNDYVGLVDLISNSEFLFNYKNIFLTY